MRTLVVNRLFPAAALAALAGSALGQSVNVDINRTTVTTVPASTYAGVAGQAGVWNNVTAGTSGTVLLLNLAGANDGCTLVRSGQGSGDATSSGGSADFSNLMSDYQTTSGSLNAGPECTVNGLDQGFYRVYVYASLPGASGYYLDQFSQPVYYNNYVSLTLNGSPAGSAITTGPLVANTFTEGVTHAAFNVAIGAGAPPLKISVKTGSSSHERCALNGFQLVKYPSGRIYVDKTKTNGGNNGLSWADAFTDLQEALEVARQSNGMINDIWVAGGVFKPTSGTDRTKSFDLVSGCKLRGHFAGTEASPAQRDLSDSSHITYLTGDIGTARFQDDNSFHIMTGTNLASTTLVDGFFITNGLANGNIQTGQQDGALAYLQNSSPQFRNCEFTNGDNSYRGGAVYANLGGPSFANCSFSDNGTGLEGGAIFWTSGTAAGSPQLKVSNCEFRGNITGGYGSAILCEGGYAVVANSLFNGMSGHGVCFIYKQTLNNDGMELINCTFTNNAGSVFGTSGGAYQTFKNCIIWGNHHNNFPSGQLAQSGWGSSLSQNCYVNLTTLQGYNSNFVPGAYNNGFDPQFVDLNGADGLAGTWDDNLHLAATSPMIDSGHNSYLPTDSCDVDWDANTSETVPWDMDGQTRLFNVPYIADTGFGSGALVDRGCYEAQFTTLPCGSPDFDCDGDVGTDADIEAFFACLAGNCPGSPCTSNADFNADGDIGTDADIEAFFRVLAGGAC